MVRVSKRHGAQVVRANAGRWSRGKEARFFQALFDTGNVQAAARAAGVSTQAIYNRRQESEAFRESWAAVLHEGRSQLQMDSVGAANRALEEIEPGAAPPISVKDALAVQAAAAREERGGAGHGGAGHGGGGRGGVGKRPRTATDAEVSAALAKQLAVFGIRVAQEEEAARQAAHARCPVCFPPGGGGEP